MRCTASLPNSRPSFAISCLLEKSHQKPMPINARAMIRIPMICPDDFDRGFVFISLGSTLIAEPEAFYHFAVTDKYAMTLHSSVSAKPISSVYFKINKISVKRFILRPQIRRFRLAIPLNARAFRIDQLRFEPFHHDLFVVGWIWPVPLCICRLGFRA